MRTRRLTLPALICCLAFALSACNSASTPAPTGAAATPTAATPTAAASTGAGSPVAGTDCDKPIKIGVLVPFTGSLNADAQEIWQAANLSIDDINSKGGVLCRKLQPILGDTADQRPDQVTAAANQLFNDPDINLIMTAYASQSNFELDLMAQHGMPYLISGNATQTQEIVTKDPSKYSTVWSMVPSYDAYNTVFAEQINQWLRNTPPFVMPSQPTVYTIASDNPYSVGIAKGLDATLEGLGWKVSGYDTVPFGNVTDWGASLAKIRADPPTLIINTDYQPSNDATFINQFRQNPTNSAVFEQYGPINAQFCQLAGANGVGVLYDSIGGPISGGNSQSAMLASDIKTKYEGKYGANSAGYFYAVGYWDVQLYKQAIAAVGDPKNRPAIAEWFSKLDTTTPSGHLKFDPATHLATYGPDYLPLQIWQIGPDCSRPLVYPPNLTTDKFTLPPWMH